MRYLQILLVLGAVWACSIPLAAVADGLSSGAVTVSAVRSKQGKCIKLKEIKRVQCKGHRLSSTSCRKAREKFKITCSTQEVCGAFQPVCAEGMLCIQALQHKTFGSLEELSEFEPRAYYLYDGACLPSAFQ